MNNQCKQHQELCDAMKENDIDYFGCLEINLDTTQQTVQQAFKNITNAAFSQLSIQFGSTPIPANHYYKPGDTMCLTCGNINSQKLIKGRKILAGGAISNLQQQKQGL
eukprot:1998796-Ditylum_brightwellii.AAC.1